MKTEQEIVGRLRELHGTHTPKEMGGRAPLAEARALLWVLGHDDPDVGYAPGRSSHPSKVDVSEYVDGVEEFR